jgi:hypothetical protein
MTEEVKQKKLKHDSKFRANVLYVYATEENKKFVRELSIQYNTPESEIINRMIEATRENKKLNLKIFVPKFVKKAEEWTKKHLTKKEE